MSGDGSTVAYRLSRSEPQNEWVVVDGREFGPFEAAGRPSMSRDARFIAYRVFRDDETFYIRIGDREEGPFEATTDPVVVPDGSTIAYAFERDDKWFLRVGGKDTPLPARPYSVFISPDGREVAWTELVERPGGGSDMRVRAFGKTGELFSIVGNVAFSPTEPLVVYGAENGKRFEFVVLGSKKIETPDRVSDPVFSADGKKVGYGARIHRELWWKVLDVSSKR